MSHNLLPLVASRILNRPLLITPDKARVILSVLEGRAGVNVPLADRFEGDAFEKDETGRIVRELAYRVTGNGVGIMTIDGELVNRGAWLDAHSGLVSYEGIKHQLKAMAQDDKVHAVILDINSPGGEAIGALEAAEQVRNLAAVKHTVAVVNGMATSAAYAIASGASEIVTTQTGVSGAIGVVLLHADFSRQLDNQGISPTLIFAGSHKVDANPFEALSENVKGDLQAEVNAFYEQFLTTVEQGRGSKLTAEMARKTEARTFIGKAAVDAGLADRLGTFESVLDELSSRARGGRITSQPRRTLMSETKGAPAANEAVYTKADLEAASAAGKAEGFKAAVERFKAILGNEKVGASAGRMKAALELACSAPDMSADAVATFVTSNVVEQGGSNASLANRDNMPDSLAAIGVTGPQKSASEQWDKVIKGRAAY